MKAVLSAIAAASILFMGLSTAMAQAPAMPKADFTSVKVGQAEIEKFIKAFPVMKTEFENFNTSLPAQNGDVSSGVNNFVTALKAQGKLDSVASTCGYSSGADLVSQFGAICYAFYAVKLEGVKTQMAAQTANLPAEAKGMVETQMKLLDQQLADAKKASSPETLGAVKGSLAEIEKAFGAASANPAKKASKKKAK